MRVREKPEGVLPAPAKEAPDESGAIEAGERPHRRTGDTREVLRLPVNGTQAAFLALPAALGAFFNLSLAANSCLTLAAMASVSTL